jgi:virulence-associated protein VagC
MVNQGNNKSQFTVSRSTKKLELNGKTGEARFFLDGANEALRLPASKSLGSYAVHIYANDMTREIQFQIQCQLNLSEDGTTEAIVSKSMDELRTQLMDKFGRK